MRGPQPCEIPVSGLLRDFGSSLHKWPCLWQSASHICYSKTNHFYFPTIADLGAWQATARDNKCLKCRETWSHSGTRFSSHFGRLLRSICWIIYFHILEKNWVLSQWPKKCKGMLPAWQILWVDRNIFHSRILLGNYEMTLLHIEIFFSIYSFSIYF